MHRISISPNNPVRRRLFETEDAEETDLDNFTNVLQEQALRAKEEKMRKWNFDFEHERPLEGAFEWTECGEREIAFVGRVRSTDQDEAGRVRSTDQDKAGAVEDEVEVSEESNTDEEYESVNLIQKRNDTTPGKNGKKKSEDAPLLSERREDDKKTVDMTTEKPGRSLQFN